MIVMYPAPTSSYSSNPPHLITKTTNKARYNDALETWADIITAFAKADTNVAAKLSSVSIIIYLACDHEANDNLIWTQ